jgi:uncharacterized protein YlzI (FlbEa/FlbD family)
LELTERNLGGAVFVDASMITALEEWDDKGCCIHTIQGNTLQVRQRAEEVLAKMKTLEKAIEAAMKKRMSQEFDTILGDLVDLPTSGAGH